MIRIVALLSLFIASTAAAQAPPLGVTARATVARVVDGDTVDVLITIPVRVRLLDCWAPEIHGPEQPNGERSKAALERLIPAGAEVEVHVPTDQASGFDSVLTFGRVLGHLWPSGGKRTVSDLMVEGGWATETKHKGPIE